MKGIFRFAAVLLGAAALTGSIAHAQKTLFYMTEDPGSERDFLAHANQVDTLSPAWYSTNAQGLLRGNADPVILKAAHDAHDTVIALVGLADKEEAHQLFQDQRAQDALNQAMIRECRQHGYAGFQLDIEDILWTDKDALSAMVQKSMRHTCSYRLPLYPGHPATRDRLPSARGCMRIGVVPTISLRSPRRSICCA
jgi:spore germination protein YaaH